MCFAVQILSQWGLGAYKIPQADMIMVPAEKVAIPQKVEVLGDYKKASQQFRPRQKQSRRFHFSFQKDDLKDAPHAVWIPHLGADTTLYINNARVKRGQSRHKALLGSGAEYIRYDIPRFLLLPGNNRVNIYIPSDPTRSGLGPVYIAPLDAVDAAQKRALWMDNILPKIGLSLGLFAFLLNIAASLGAKFRAEFLVLSFAGGSLAALSYFGGTLPLLTTLAGLLLYGVLQARGSKLNFMLLTVFGLAVIGFILSLIRAFGPLTFPSPSLITPLIWLGALPLLLLPAMLAISKAIQARRSRVEILETELDDTKDDLEREIRKRAIFEERERLTRDIHDGVGGQLLGLLLKLRTGDLPKETITRDLQDGINDLRLVVDALDHTGNDLSRALTAFKERADNQLDAAGLNLKWTQQDPLAYEPQSRDAVLHLYRLLQEALNNVIRHAKASEVHVDIQINKEGTLQISVLDNGIGRDETVKAGHGTLNMQRRADLLGAKLETGKGIDGAGHGIVAYLPMS